MSTARLYRVILPVRDIARAAAFWSAVLETPGIRVSPGRHYFACGGTLLACYDPVADGDELGDGWHHHPSQYLYFAVDDLERAAERLVAAGARELTPIATMPWVSGCSTHWIRSTRRSASWTRRPCSPAPAPGGPG